MTTSSRAPDVNLFNKPRVTLWPLQLDPEPGSGRATRTAKDHLIAFSSTIGNTPYYFQRYNTYDYSSGGPNDRGSGPYNPSQSPMPSSQSPLMDFYLSSTVSTPPSPQSRNQELYTYLQSVTSSPIPGLGGSLGGKYSGSRDQILTQMFDYIRSNINLTTTGITAVGGTTGYTYAPFVPSGSTRTGQFQVVPAALPNGTKGFGSGFPTITQAALVFYRLENIFVRGGEQTDFQKVYRPPVVNTEITAGPTPIMGAFLILQPFTPTPGPPHWSTNLRIRIEGLEEFTINGNPMGFPSEAVNLVTTRDSRGNATALTALEAFTQYWPLQVKRPGTSPIGDDKEEEFYPFVSAPIPITGSSFNFSGGSIKIELYSAYSKDSIDPGGTGPLQTINMEFPAGNGWPIPEIAYNSSAGKTTDPETGEDIPHTTVSQWNNIRNRFGVHQTGGYGIQQGGQHSPLPLIRSQDTVRAVEARYGGPGRGDYRLIHGLRNVPDTFFEGHGMKDPSPVGRKYTDTAVNFRLLHSLRVDALSGSSMAQNVNGFYVGSTSPGGRPGKLLAAASYYTGGNKGNREPVAPRGLAEATMANGSRGDWDTGVGTQRDGPYINKADLGNVGSKANSTDGYYNEVGHYMSHGNDTVVDAGASYSPNRQISSAVSFGSLPVGINQSNPDDSHGWQTLLFAKNPLAGSNHPGFGLPVEGPPYTTAPDHAFLDLFTMPVVEPYAISEPFSTAGKVNMNYQIVPFTYVTRSTAVRAVLKATNMMAIPTSTAPIYKQNQTNVYPPDGRYTINPDEKIGTLAGFEQRFQKGDIFRSASEICDIFLVPKGRVDGVPAPDNPTYQTMEEWWQPYQLTGDNVRESPYGHIYPRLTTKSNTYTVHVMTQWIQKTPLTPPDEFVEGRDQVAGEYRGSYIIERYLDPNSDSLVKADGKTAANELDDDAMVGPYKFRVIGSKRFAP